MGLSGDFAFLNISSVVIGILSAMSKIFRSGSVCLCGDDHTITSKTAVLDEGSTMANYEIRIQ
jgi:hypothetical protein